MNHLMQAVWMHHGYAPAYGYHHGYGGGGWISNMIMSAVVHSLIYGLVFKMMRHLTIPEAILLVGCGLLAVFVWLRQRDRRGW